MPDRTASQPDLEKGLRRRVDADARAAVNGAAISPSAATRGPTPAAAPVHSASETEGGQLPVCAYPPAHLGLEDWVRCAEGHARMRHGDWPRWQAAISALPEYASDFALSADVVCVGDNLFGDCDDAHPGEDVPSGPVSAVTETLELLMPWRKGPFRVGGIHIDSEWRSDLKWARLAPHLPELTGKRVLDVGGGNGYFGFRLLAGGADAVIGIDPTLRFLAQYELLHRLARKTRQWILPLRLEEVSPPARGFDLVLSMGVLYHQRDPEAHLRDLCAQARPGAEVVVETLILPPAAVPTHGPLLRPTGRYARMRNVWALPSLEILLNWITAAGLTHARCVDVCPTLPAEQRTTRWMQGPSLRDFLDPTDAGLTEEGLPAPTRAIIVARCPGDAAGSRVPADVGEPGGP